MDIQKASTTLLTRQLPTVRVNKVPDLDDIWIVCIHQCWSITPADSIIVQFWARSTRACAFKTSQGSQTNPKRPWAFSILDHLLYHHSQLLAASWSISYVSACMCLKPLPTYPQLAKRAFKEIDAVISIRSERGASNSRLNTRKASPCPCLLHPSPRSCPGTARRVDRHFSMFGAFAFLTPFHWPWQWLRWEFLVFSWYPYFRQEQVLLPKRQHTALWQVPQPKLFGF